MENKKLLRKIAWEYAKRSRVDFQDLYQEACLAYLEAIRTHNIEKGSITTFTWHCVANHLKNYITTELKQQGISIDDCDSYKPEFSYYSESIFDSLSKDATEVVRIIIDSPFQFLALANNKFKVQRQVRKMLTDKNWNKAKIENAFKNLKIAYS
jgi:DNA-directed RNA polymerase specialized sigma24 family protein